MLVGSKQEMNGSKGEKHCQKLPETMNKNIPILSMYGICTPTFGIICLIFMVYM